LNPLQFNSAANAAGLSAQDARRLFSATCEALRGIDANDVQQHGEPRPLTPKVMPVAARGNLKRAIEEQNERRAAAVELEVIPGVFLSFCAGAVADVRIARG
jgi:hypothetical protein